MLMVDRLHFLDNRNDFFGSIIYLNSKERCTFALRLPQLKRNDVTKYKLMIAGTESKGREVRRNWEKREGSRYPA